MSTMTESVLEHTMFVCAGVALMASSASAQDRGFATDVRNNNHDAALAGECPPGDPDDPSTIGAWEHLPDLTELMVVHGAVMPTGKVLMFSGELEQGLPHLSLVWDPVTNEQTIQGPIDEDQFCSGHTQLADGRVLIFGGDGAQRNQTYIFDPWTEEWEQIADMENGRWYPTGVTLGDGRVVVFSGWGGVGNSDEVEVWDPATETWSTYGAQANRDIDIYPSMHLMPNGKIFYSATSWQGGQGWNGASSAWFDPEAGTWETLGPHVNGQRSEAIAVLVPELEPGAEPWRVLVAGGWAGGENNQDTAEIIDLTDGNPQWTNIQRMTNRRNNANGVILPTGEIAMIAGISGWKWGPFNESFGAEHFDPVTETWTEMASMDVGAQYHSIGLLLPDGRLIKTGGHLGGGVNVHDMEVYSPRYLFNGPRPVINSAPEEIGWGNTFSITASQAEDATMVSLVKLSQITHHTNSDQRFLSLAFEHTGGDNLSITAPAHGNIAPPGYYMLFVINQCGVPSEAAMVRLDEILVVCDEDFNNDGEVGSDDLLFLLGHWGDPGGPADINGDGAVNTIDLVILLGAWGPCV